MRENGATPRLPRTKAQPSRTATRSRAKSPLGGAISNRALEKGDAP